MSSDRTVTTGEVIPKKLTESAIKLSYLLLFFPLLALYPLYYAYVNADEDRDIEEEMENSPLYSVPGFSEPDSMVMPVVSAVLSALLLVGVIYGPVIARGGSFQPTPIGLVTGPLGTTFLGALLGLGVPLYLVNHLERDLLRRIGLTILAGLSFGILVGIFYVGYFGIPIEASSLAEPILVPAVATLYGGSVANGYLVKSQEIKQRQKKKGEASETRDHTETKSYKGSTVDDDKGEAIVEEFAESTWVVPDDLPGDSTVEKTRKIEPLRDIVRTLWVDESLYKKTIPETQFSSAKSKHRTDYERRDRVAPDGFKSATYSFYKPGSKDVHSCDKCSGRGELDCTQCNRSGTVTCGTCSGAGETQCRNCRGNGKITVDEKCGVCRGSGETSNGWECDNCGGYGSVERTKRCPDCYGGTVDCSNCGGSGKLTCSSCSGRGTHDCEKCDACGRLATFKYVERSYSPDEDVSYRNKSVPIGLLKDANGTQVELETDNNPSQSNLYRRQDETREIPVLVATYKYLGDTWEIFNVEGTTKARDFPRDYRRQFRVVMAGLFVSVPAYLFLLYVGV